MSVAPDRLDPAAGAPTARHEYKFALAAGALPHVDLWLRTSALGFRVAHPPRQVSNLYFDTTDGEAFADKLAGVSSRAKVRFRWYGAASPGPVVVAGQLEVKRRHNGVGWKETYPVAALPAVRSRAELVRALRQQVPPRARLWLDQFPEPMLLNQYHRRYYVSADGSVRATVDTDLKVFDQRGAVFPQLHRRAPMPALLVLELKLLPSARARAAAELADLGFVVSALSKYDLGVRAITGW